jgi:NAD(P)-dependent dehydrogenase (short-subunit alcohol dehydrogenase family)
MPTIAVVGAGPGLGLSIAKRFGREGFAEKLGKDGIEAAGFAADVTDARALSAVFADIAERFGPVDVLSFSPSAPENARLRPVTATEVTLDDAVPQLRWAAIAEVIGRKLGE